MASNICSWAGLWEAAPDLDIARHAHTATVLKNGKILICGGFFGGGPVATAQLYDPGTRAYAPAGSLAIPRYGHQATRLKDGNVLVTGGYAPVALGQLASAELYNWMTGTWSLLPAQMSSRRAEHTATLTSAGNVMLAGGFGGTQPFSALLDTIEMFILTSATFSPISHKMQVARWRHTATLQENGVILVAGGEDLNGPVKQAETYDPSHPPFNPVSNMSVERSGHTATLVPGLGVLITGGVGPISGGGPAHVIHASAELFAGTHFSTISSMATARTAHTAVDLGDGEVLVCGGENSSGPLASAEIYTNSLNGFRSAGNMATARSRTVAAITGDGGVLVCGGKSTKARLPEPRDRFTATRVGVDNAVVIGGRNSAGQPQSLTTVLLYKGVTDAFTQIGSITTPRSEHTVTLLASPDRFLIVGGSSPTNQALTSVEMFDFAQSIVVQAGQLGGARSAHTATLLPNGKVLVVGGALAGLPLKTTELYDPATNAFSPTGSLTYGRHGHTATLLPNGTVLIAGGMSTDSAVPGGTGITFTTEIYDPAAGTFALQPQPNRLLVNRTNHTATILGNGKVLFAGGLSVGIAPTNKAELYDPGSNSFASTGSMAAPRYRHTATVTVMPNGQVMFVGGHAGSGGPKTRVVELYDPTTGTFSRTGDSWYARVDHATVLNLNGKVLVIGGSVDGDATSAELSKATDCTTVSKPSATCFIATAAFGSELHPEVERLRRYRDSVLMTSVSGRLFVWAYYRCSPPVAALVRRSAALRALVRWVLR